MHFAPLLLFVALELLLFVAGRLTPVPPWLHLVAAICLPGVLLLLCATRHKREEQVRDELQLEISGMQQEMAKAARRYKSLLEGAGNAIFVCNAESGALEEVNRIGTELLGFSKEELSSMVGRDLLHPDQYEMFRAFMLQLKRRGRADTPEGLRFQRKDGSLFLGEIEARVIDLGDQQVVHCILRDVTENRRREREIRQRNRELSVLNHVLTGLNRGSEQEGVQAETLAEIMELVQAQGATLHLMGEGGAPAELRVSHRISPHLEHMIRDCITRQPESFHELRSCVGNTEEHCISAAAEGWSSLTAVPLTAQDHLVGVMHLMHPAPQRFTEEELRFLGTIGKQMGNVIESGRLFAELSWKSAELLRSHHLLEKASHNLSVSEIKLKRNLDLVEQAHLDLSRLDRMKTQFLGMVSHEFNTPLTSILAGVDHLLQHGCDSKEDAHHVLQMVRDGGMRLKELVADLLRLIRLEARGGGLETSAVHLGRFMENLTERLQPQLDKRSQTVKLTGLDALPFFDGDHGYLERVFGELLLNAVRFSPAGGEIEVTGRVTGLQALQERRDTLERFNSGFLKRCGDRCYLEVEVRDHGIGIPPEEQQRIFDIFYEVGEIKHHSSGRSRFQGKGAGLGLAIVKGMVEAHGGMVWVESEEGSSFFLLLPLEQEASQPELF